MSQYTIIKRRIADLISVQQNLKYLCIIQYACKYLTTDIINSLAKLPNTLIELNLYGGELYIPFSFIAKLTRLQKMRLSYENPNVFEDFITLQYVAFSQLRVLKFQYKSPRNELLVKFLEINGKN